MRLTILRPFVSLALVFALSVSLLPAKHALAAPAGVTITVTTGLDDDGSTCDSNACTLRGAINKANTNGQTFNVIVFAPSVSTVSVTNGPLPTITNTGLSINGSYNNTFPRINGANGGTFFINASYVTIVYLTIVNTQNGTDIQIDGGNNIAIGNNYLGTVANAPNCAYVSTNQGWNGVRVMPNNTGNATTPVAYIYGNVIACHQYEGILVRGATVKIGHDRSDQVVPNLIGVMDNGVSAGGNGWAGIAITDWVYSATDNLIEGNVISGNGYEGIYVFGTISTDIEGNIIGLNAPKSTPIPNGLAGIALVGAQSATVGSSPTSYNLIAGNTREGIYIINSSNVLVWWGTVIGAPVPSGNSPIKCQPGWGNGLAGILLVGTTDLSVITPGLVGCNGRAGIATYGTATQVRNRIAPLMVGENGGLPIDRGDDGVTPLNYPKITSVQPNGQNVTIAGTACANCDVYIYAARGNPAAAGGGGVLIDSATANSAGQWSVTVSSSTVTPLVTALAPASFSAHVYDPYPRGTFELSPRPQVFLPLVIK